MLELEIGAGSAEHFDVFCYAYIEWAIYCLIWGGHRFFFDFFFTSNETLLKKITKRKRKAV